MCGIAGYSGNKSAELQIIQTLKKLEHRGYDSAGIALLNKNSIYIVKAVGKINALEEKLHSHQIDSHLGIGHTRWATHGKVCIENTHPHQDCKKCIAVVHNGIIENYRQIKKKLESQHKFQSATDTEVIPHLIEHFLQETNSIEEAFLKTIKSLTGSFAIAMIYKNDNRIFFAQKNSTLIIYQDAEETYLVSDPAGLPEKAKDIIPVQDDEWGMISNGTICLFDITGKIKKPRSIVFNQNIKNENAQHFFLKEIFQQPETIISTLRSSLSFFDTTGKNIFKDIDKILFIGCGSSYYAGLIGKYFFEEIAKIPSAVEYASEISCLLNSNGKNTLVIALSQSGETRDTISAVKKIQESRILAITNVANSLITRIVPYHILLHVGPEISVAATKSFTGQIICLYVASLKLAYEKGVLSQEKINEMLVEILRVSNHIDNILFLKDMLHKIAKSIANSENIFVLGRGINFPVALEGALKLKEVSGIHAEGIPAAEMKHGPISLITEQTPVFFIAPKDKTYDKLINNIEEIKSRGGKTIVITTENSSDIEKITDEVICIPDVGDYLSPVCSVIPFQLLSYFIAIEKNMPVDRPRNLAKTVTVE